MDISSSAPAKTLGSAIGSVIERSARGRNGCAATAWIAHFRKRRAERASSLGPPWELVALSALVGVGVALVLAPSPAPSSAPGSTIGSTRRSASAFRKLGNQCG